MLPELKEVPNLDKTSLNRLLNEAFYESDEQREAILCDPQASQIKKWVRSIIKAGNCSGDIQRLQGLLDRAIGKVKEQIEFSGSIELASALHKARQRLKDKND